MTVSQGSQTIQRLCRLAGVSRAGYYRFWRKSAPREHDTMVRDAIQRVALGYRPPVEFEAWHRASLGPDGRSAARADGFAPRPPAQLLDRQVFRPEQ